MDHRCLYGHRVPVGFTFSIQSRTCPTCGAPTVTVNGYTAARKLATEAGLDAVAAFHALRVIEAEWVLSPAVAAAASAPASGIALAAEPVLGAAPPAEEEEVVVEDDPPAPPPRPSPVSAPEPRITARVKVDKRAEAASAPGFGRAEDDFFKGA